MFVTSEILSSLAQKGVLSVVQHDPELVPQAKGIVQWVQREGEKRYKPCTDEYPAAKLSCNRSLVPLNHSGQPVGLILPVFLLSCSDSVHLYGGCFDSLLQALNLINRKSVMAYKKIPCGKIKVTLSLHNQNYNKE